MPYRSKKDVDDLMMMIKKIELILNPKVIDTPTLPKIEAPITNRPTCNHMTKDGVCGKPAHNTGRTVNRKWRKVKNVGYVCGKHYHYFKPSTKKGLQLPSN